MAYGFYWGRQCSWTLTTANSMQVSNIQSDFVDITISIKMHIKGTTLTTPKDLVSNAATRNFYKEQLFSV